MSSEGETSTQRSAKEPTLDCYAILGVHPNAEDVVIRAAFKALAQRYHPDRFSGSKEEAHRRMSDLTHAYEVLCDPVRRGKYDRRRRLKAHGASFALRDATRDNAAPGPSAPSPVTAAAKQRRYRQAVGALVGAVVILSAFNLYQYSGRLRAWLGSPSTPSAVPSVSTRGVAETPIPIVTGVSSDPPPELPVARPRTMPAAPTTRAITAGSTPIETVAPSPASDAGLATPSRTPPRAVAGDVPARTSAASPPPASASSAGATQAARKDATPPAPAAPAAADALALPRSVATRSTPPAGTQPSGLDPLAPPKSVATKSAPAEDPGAAPKAAGACTDAVIALGLCKTNTTAKAP